MNTDLISYLKQFNELTAQDIELISAGFQKKKLKSGDKLTEAGLVTTQLFFISKGILKITIPRDSERNMVYYFLEQSQFMTFLYSLYGNVPAEHGLEAATDCEVLCLNKEDLYLLFDKIVPFRTLLDSIAHLSMVDMINTKNAYIAYDALRSYQLFLEKQPKVALRVSLIDIASYLGITPQSLSRIRRKAIE